MAGVLRGCPGMRKFFKCGHMEHGVSSECPILDSVTLLPSTLRRRWTVAEPEGAATPPLLKMPGPRSEGRQRWRHLAEACAAARVNGAVRVTDLRGAKPARPPTTPPTSLRSVALPSPPRLSLPDATPKQGFAFLGGGTAPPQEARFSGLAAQQTLSPMPAAKPVAAKPVGAPAGTGPLFGSPAPSSGLFGAMPQSSAAPPASLSKKETKPALTAPTAAKTAAAPAAATKATPPASAAAAPKPKPSSSQPPLPSMSQVGL